jgi:tetratricopeptide (TPR) repeat protein
MTRGFVLITGVGLLLMGCLSKTGTTKSEGPRKPNHLVRKEKAVDEHGLKYFPGIGWRYFKPGMDAEILQYSPIQLMDYARNKFAEGEYDEAMFASRLYIELNPGGDSAPEALQIVGESYEKRSFDEHAFKAYQALLSRYPNYKKSDEVMGKMYSIAESYLNGQWFRWKLPYQETVFIPTGPSMTRTSQMYSQIVTNAPYGKFAAKSQFGIGQAHENALRGFWGFFVSENEYGRATRAYQLLTDRYSQREGDADRPEQEDLNEMVASARFRMAQLFEIQANEGIYDQSMPQHAIDAYRDFMALHKEDKTQTTRRDEANQRIKGMRMERARGLKSIAEFYEEREKWVAAFKYYGQIQQVLIEGGGNLLEDKLYQEEASGLDELARLKISSELVAKRINQALASYARAKRAEREVKLNAAQQGFRVANLNLHTLTETSMKNLVTNKMLTPDSLAEATKVKSSVGKDLERIGAAINAPIVGPQPKPENE